MKLKKLFLQNKVQIVSAFCLYVLMAVFSIRKLLSTVGTVGHNWDWSVPNMASFLSNQVYSSFYLWKDSVLGFSAMSLTLPVKLLRIILVGPFSLLDLDGNYFSKFLLIFTMTLAAFGMYLCLRRLLKHYKLEANLGLMSFVGGLLYGFSPFLFSEFIGGAMSQFLAYALWPWCFLSFHYLINSSRKIYLLTSAVLITALMISIQQFVFVVVMFCLYCSWYAWLKKDWQIIKRLILVGVFSLFLNAYWIVPMIADFGYLSGLKAQKGFAGIALKNIQSAPKVWQMLVGTGFFDRHMFTATMSNVILPIWYAVMYLSLAGTFLYVTIKKKFNKDILFWLFTFVIFMIFATSGNPPFGDFVLWLVQHFSAYAMFRSAQHYIPGVLFCLTIIFAYGFTLIFEDLKKVNKKIAKSVLIIILLVWSLPYWYLGDIGREVLTKKNKDHIDVYQLNPDLEEVYEYLDENLEGAKVLAQPISFSPAFVPNDYQLDGQGVDVNQIFAPFNVVVDQGFSNKMGEKLLQGFRDFQCQAKNSELYSKMLQILNIQYVYFRTDIVPHFSCARIWNISQQKEYLMNNKDLNLLSLSENIDLYEYNDFTPFLYIANKDIVIDGDMGSLISYLDISEYNNNFKPVIHFSEAGQYGEYAVEVIANNTDIDKLAEFNKELKEATEISDSEEQARLKREVNYNTENVVLDDYKLEIVHTGEYEIYFNLNEAGLEAPVYLSLDDKVIRSDVVMSGDWIDFGKFNLEKDIYSVDIKNAEGHSIYAIPVNNLLFVYNQENIQPDYDQGLEFAKLNPGKYVVEVPKLDGIYSLVFNNGYNSGWTIKTYETDKEQNFFTKVFSRDEGNLAPVRLANGYANSWQLDDSVLGPTRLVVLEFWPQNVFYFGGLISIIALGMLVVYVVCCKKDE
ncbi:hypothetical protein HN643_05685 [Candidatus Falkowbacteria bacterium]|nr:hypothetical protein [Candidatus Falkowbacteria bacterium]MBT6573489.1 hypothetical protein [Candidatus Falkowbacteria bacterium]MBT7501126.1 hypothetical protein [Candidatus Falkowbacteria bacterium]